MGQSMMLRIPAERGVQLKHLAEASGQTMTQLIEKWILVEFQRSRLPYFLPGCLIKRTATNKAITLELEGLGNFTLSKDEIRKFSTALRQVVRLGSSVKFTASSSNFRIARRGGGILMEVRNRYGVEDKLLYQRVVVPSFANEIAGYLIRMIES